MSKNAPNRVHCRTDAAISFAGLAIGRQRLQIGTHLVPGSVLLRGGRQLSGPALVSFRSGAHVRLRISRKLGTDFARSWALVSRHAGQPFRGIVGRLADSFMESGLSGLVKGFCDGGAPAEAIT